MITLGRALVFHLKYPAEMRRLYWHRRSTGEAPSLDGLIDGEAVLAMVGKVAEAACREVATFLNACSERVVPNLETLGRVASVRGSVEKTWELQWRVFAGKAKKPFYVGVGVYDQAKAVIPWIWCRGGRRGADELLQVLPGCKRGRDYVPGWGAGTIALDHIDVSSLGTVVTAEVDREPLIERVVLALALTSDKANAIAELAK